MSESTLPRNHAVIIRIDRVTPIWHPESVSGASDLTHSLGVFKLSQHFLSAGQR
jgi:hypothetical protein